MRHPCSVGDGARTRLFAYNDNETRRHMGVLISGRLHNLICKTSNCYESTMVC